jgi:hypothetical protein
MAKPKLGKRCMAFLQAFLLASVVGGELIMLGSMKIRREA